MSPINAVGEHKIRPYSQEPGVGLVERAYELLQREETALHSPTRGARVPEQERREIKYQNTGMGLILAMTSISASARWFDLRCVVQ